MNKLNLSACLSALLLAPSTPASAQQIIIAGNLTLAGYRASCGPVETVVMEMYDIAEARNGRIFLNKSLMSRPRAQQIFWYTHECAPHFRRWRSARRLLGGAAGAQPRMAHSQ